MMVQVMDINKNGIMISLKNIQSLKSSKVSKKIHKYKKIAINNKKTMTMMMTLSVKSLKNIIFFPQNFKNDI